MINPGLDSEFVGGTFHLATFPDLLYDIFIFSGTGGNVSLNGR